GVREEHGPGTRDRLGRQPTGTVDALAQAHDLHPAGQLDQVAARLGQVRHEQPHRVGPAVDRRYPGHVTTLATGRHRPAVAGGRREWTERPRGGTGAGTSVSRTDLAWGTAGRLEPAPRGRQPAVPPPPASSTNVRRSLRGVRRSR